MRNQDEQQVAGHPAREGAEQGYGEGAASALARLRSLERAKAQTHGADSSAEVPSWPAPPPAPARAHGPLDG
jgi:hypothetical protein